MLTNAVRFIIGFALVSALSYAGLTLSSWYDAYSALGDAQAEAKAFRDKYDERSQQTIETLRDNQELEGTVGELKLQIQAQNHAVELASQQSQAAQAQQEQARAYAARLQDQSQARIRLLESDLQDATKTVSDMLDNNWRQQP